MGLERTADAPNKQLASGSVATGPRAVASNVLALHTPSYCCAWVGIVTLHVTCAVYLTQLARVYWFIQHPYLEYFTRLATGDRYIYLHHASVVIGLVSTLHYWQLLCILYASVRARALTFPDDSAGIGFAITRLTSTRSARSSRSRFASSRLASVMASTRVKALTWPTRLILQLWQLCFSRHGVFGIESRVFHAVFTVREVVEIVSQTFQARRSSELLPRPWLNNLFHVFRRHPGQERVVCLVLDALLNMGSSMAVPLAVFWPYYEAFDPATFLFPAESLYNAVWFPRFTMETQLLFSMTTLDVISKLVPHIGIYSSLTSVVLLIHRRAGRRPRQRQRSVLVSVAPVTADAREPLSKATKRSRYTRTPTAVVIGTDRKRTTHCWQAAVHLLFVLWGLALLTLHLRAVTHTHDAVLGCLQVTRSWFARGYPCSVYTYNCYRHGVASPDEDAWTHLDTDTLAFMTMAHCPALNVPRAFQSFPNLVGVHLHNITLVDWSTESGISATKHARMIVLLVTHANMTALPNGVLGPLPASLIDIEFSHTNLTALPPDLHECWHALATVYFEHSLLTEFPEALLHLGASEISLFSNRIETVPALPPDQYFFLFVLSSNPIRELPADVGRGTVLSFVSLEDTLVASLPSWVHTNVESTVFLHNTPYCATTQARDTLDGARLLCMERDDRIDGKIPLYVIDPGLPV